MRTALLLLAFVASPAAAKEIFNDKVAVLEEFPREIGRGKEIRLKGMRKGAWSGPELIVIAPNGRTYLCLKLTQTQYGFEFEVEFDEGVGAYRFELILRAQTRGVKTAAQFTIWHGVRKPKVVREEPLPDGPPTPPELHVRLVEKRFLARLNAFRASIKLDPVGWNEAVAAQARDHAWRMAKAQRTLNKFGGWGVQERIRKEGAAKWAPWSGPDEGWPRVVNFRPFPPPALKPAGPGVNNHIVENTASDFSLNHLFVKDYEREAAFRLLAADPHCLEVGVGCAREQKGDPKRVYYCVCFVQVNVKGTHRAQEAAFRKVLKAAKGKDAKAIRRMAMWSRPKPAASILKSALRDKDPAVRGAALDGYLLLDEEDGRKRIGEIEARAESAARAKRYGEAYADYASMAQVFYDARVWKPGRTGVKAVTDAANTEYKEILARPEAEQKDLLRAFKRRIKGMPLADELK
ncbi:MAG: CAP domain-containing protein [Planctomycetota bacterium]|jgi:hypothetical protein